MKKLLPSLGLLLLSGFPAATYAQEPEPDPEPTKLTIAYDVVKPASTSFGNEVPKEFVLDFSVSSLDIIEVKYNGEYSIVSPANENRDAVFSGKFAYLEMNLDASSTWTSAPLNVKVNPDKTVSLSLDFTDTPNFETALKDPNIYTLTLIVPEGLFSVDAKNINNKLLTYESIAQNFIYNHLGDIQIVEPTKLSPASGTIIDRLQTIDLGFKIDYDGVPVQWANIIDKQPTVFAKYEGETTWSEIGTATASIDYSDSSKAQIKIIPAMSTKGQYRVDVPLGTFMMYAQNPEGSSQEDPNTNLAIFCNPALSLRYAIGEEVQEGLPKSTILAFSQPAEGTVNLEQIPSGVEYLQLVFTSIPKIDRSVSAPLQLFYNGGTTPIKELSARNETLLRLQTNGISNDYGNLLHVYFDGGESNIDMPGDYTAVFPAGLFLFGDTDEPSARMELNFHIDRVLQTELYPRPQTSVDTFDGFTISFTNAVNIELNTENEEPIRLETRNGSLYTKATEVTIEGKIARVKFEEQTESGYYFITIPEGFFTVNLDNEILPNQIIEREWMIKSLPMPQIDPAPGVLSSNVIFEVNFDLGDEAEITDVFRNEETFTRLLKVADNGEIIYTPVISYFKVDLPENSIGNSYLTMIPRDGKPRTLTPGNYVFIPCPYLYTLKGGLTNGEYFYFWTVLPELPEFPKPTLTPNDNVKSSNMFKMEFGENVMLKSRSTELSYLYPLNSDGTLGKSVASFKAMTGSKPNEVDLVNITGVEPLETGVYNLRTPRGICWDSNNVAGAYSFDIYVGMSGATVIGEHGSNYDIFTLDGVTVRRKASATEINNLSPGIYLVGGKKIIVK